MAIRHSDEFDSYPLKVGRFTTYDVTGRPNVVKLGGGMLHTLSFGQTEQAPSAGKIVVYDSSNLIYANGAKILFYHTFGTGAFVPFSVELNAPFSSGLQLGFSTSIKNVSVTVVYK